MCIKFQRRKLTMKRILASTILTAMATSAMAAVTIDYRSDWKSLQDYKGTANQDLSGYSEFRVTRARAKMSHKLSDTVTFNGRLNFLGASTAPTKDGAGGLFEYGWISHKAHDMLMVNFGKIVFAKGGTENYLYGGASGDTYFNSFTSLAQLPYGMGLGLDVYFAENQILTVGAINNEDTNATTQKKTGLIATYRGDFMDNMLKVIVMYNQTSVGQPGMMNGGANAVITSNERNLNHTSLSAQIKPIANLVVNLDYYNSVCSDCGGNGKSNTSLLPTGPVFAAGTAGKSLASTSTVLEVRYTFDQWTPVAKYEMSSLTDDGTATATGDATSSIRNRTGVALEFKPKADEAFRYHFSWDSQVDTGKASGALSVTQNTYMFGVRGFFDFLK